MTLPKGFIELHLVKSNTPVLVKVNLIGFMSPVTTVDDRYQRRAVDWTHIVSLAHNNGGFDVSESYNEVCKKMIAAQAKED